MSNYYHSTGYGQPPQEQQQHRPPLQTQYASGEPYPPNGASNLGGGQATPSYSSLGNPAANSRHGHGNDYDYGHRNYSSNQYDRMPPPSNANQGTASYSSLGSYSALGDARNDSYGAMANLPTRQQNSYGGMAETSWSSNGFSYGSLAAAPAQPCDRKSRWGAQHQREQHHNERSYGRRTNPPRSDDWQGQPPQHRQQSQHQAPTPIKAHGTSISYNIMDGFLANNNSASNSSRGYGEHQQLRPPPHTHAGPTDYQQKSDVMFLPDRPADYRKNKSDVLRDLREGIPKPTPPETSTTHVATNSNRGYGDHQQQRPPLPPPRAGPADYQQKSDVMFLPDRPADYRKNKSDVLRDLREGIPKPKPPPPEMSTAHVPPMGGIERKSETLRDLREPTAPRRHDHGHNHPPARQRHTSSNPSTGHPPPMAPIQRQEASRDLTREPKTSREISSTEPTPKPPLPPEPRPQSANAPKKESNAAASNTDGAVDAINALSNLQNRWSGPSGKRKDPPVPAEQPENQKGKKRRKRGKKNKKNNVDNLNEQGSQVVIREPGEVGNDWIDVKDESLSKYQKPKGMEIISADDFFPPLAPEKSPGEIDEGEAARVTLKDKPTSQLQSYAAALGNALDSKNVATSKSVHNLQNGNSDEMDISEEDEEAVVNEASTEFRELQKKLGKYIKAPNERAVDVNLTADGPIVDLTGAEFNSPIKPPQKDLEELEKQRRALKLAELKAKAKLARAKLRIAEQKKAQGDVARNELASSQSNPNNVSSAALLPLIAITGLVIDNVALTGPAEEVRYDVGSDYTLFPPSSYRNRATAEESKTKAVNKSEALKKKLELAKLQLEMKKKKAALLKRKAQSANNENRLSPVPNELDSATEVRASGAPTLKEGDPQPGDELPAENEFETKLEQLRRRQKELKHSNDVANLRNLIHRQRDLLQAQRQELEESSTQLQSCVDTIASKENSLKESDNRMAEMNNRKRILEGMVMRATEQLVAARKALSERRRQPNA